MRKSLFVFLGLTVLFLALFLIRFGRSSVFFSRSSMKLTSPAFVNGGVIPVKYTCQGENVSPPFFISEIPADAHSLVLIFEDLDAPLHVWAHWLLWNIAPQTRFLTENTVPVGAVSGTTSFGHQKYGGPCPPVGTHHYLFRLFALDTTLNLPPEAQKNDLEALISGHILAQTDLSGFFP